MQYKSNPLFSFTFQRVSQESAVEQKLLGTSLRFPFRREFPKKFIWNPLNSNTYEKFILT